MKKVLLVLFVGALAVSCASIMQSAGAKPYEPPCVPTEDSWQRYSWTGGPRAEDDPPPGFPDAGWQPNVAGDPHGIGVAGPYFVSHGGSGLGDWFYLELVEGVDCPPPPTTVPTTAPPTTAPPQGVAFAFSDPTPPTCEAAGDFLQATFPGVSITVDPAFDGPGTYTVTATLDDPNDTWADIGGNEPRSREITVEDALGFQSEDPNAPCFLEPPCVPADGDLCEPPPVPCEDLANDDDPTNDCVPIPCFDPRCLPDEPPLPPPTSPTCEEVAWQVGCPLGPVQADPATTG